MSEVNNIQSKFEFANHVRKVLREARELKVNEKKYHKAMKELLGISQKDIDHIVERYTQKPEKQRHKLLPLFQSITDNLKIYLKEEVIILKLLNKMIVEILREEYDEEGEIDKIMHLWYQTAREKGSIFTEKIIRDLKKGYEEHRERIEGDAKKDIRNDRRLIHERKPKVGFFNRIASDKKLARKLKRLGKKARKEDKKVERMKAEMHRQLKSTGGQLSFPYLFLKVLKEEGELDAILQKVRLDIQEMSYKAVENNNKMVSHVRPLLGLFSNYKEFHDDRMLHALLKDHDELIDKRNKLAHEDYQDEVSVYRLEERNEEDFQKLTHLLEIKRHHNEKRAA